MKLSFLVCRAVPSNFADTNVRQFAFTVQTLGITNRLCAGKVGVLVVIFVLPSSQALDCSIGVTNVTVLGLKISGRYNLVFKVLSKLKPHT